MTQMDHDEAQTATFGGPRTAAPVAQTAALVLAFADGALSGVQIPLGEAPLVLGRNELRAIGIDAPDPRMSRRHAEVRHEGGRWVLRDLGSRNGTYVNGEPISAPRPLVAGDVIRAGNTLMVFAAGAPPDALGDPDLVGVGAAIASVRNAVATVASHALSVLVTGETGAGKEVVARAIHRHSGRRGEFVAINCGGLSEGVLESELFGHTKGAFTGAAQHREGLFRAADGGTLFLDELGEMPPPLQVKLLRVLETRKVRPVGSVQEQPVDVRIVAATNRDVLGAVQGGTLRSDLYARLAQWHVHVPPLRERREDLPHLIRHLLARQGAQGRAIDVGLVEELLLHPWPLNVRGLSNVLSIAVISSEPGRPLGLHEQVSRALAAERALAGPATGSTLPPSTPAPIAPAEPSRPTASAIESALRELRGNVAEVARHFGASRQQLYRWLSAYEIDPARFRKAGSADD